MCGKTILTRGHAFFADMRGVREFEEKFETLGPLMFGLADGQSEAPKIMAKKVKLMLAMMGLDDMILLILIPDLDDQRW